MRTCTNCKTTILADHWTHCIDCHAALPPVRSEPLSQDDEELCLVRSDALLAECLVFIEELGHGPACDSWSGRRDTRCDCDIPRLIRRVKKQLKANTRITAPSRKG